MISRETPSWRSETIRRHLRAARPSNCRRCGAPVLIGPDADVAAVTVTVDPGPLDAVLEAAVLLTGRRTYDVVNTIGPPELWHRAHYNISAPRRWPVVTDHKCGAVLVPHTPASTPAPAPVLDIPPF